MNAEPAHLVPGDDPMEAVLQAAEELATMSEEVSHRKRTVFLVVVALVAAGIAIVVLARRRSSQTEASPDISG